MFLIILIHNIFNTWNNRQKKIERDVLTQEMQSPPTLTAMEPLHTANPFIKNLFQHHQHHINFPHQPKQSQSITHHHLQPQLMLPNHSITALKQSTFPRPPYTTLKRENEKNLQPPNETTNGPAYSTNGLTAICQRQNISSTVGTTDKTVLTLFVFPLKGNCM